MCVWFSFLFLFFNDLCGKKERERNKVTLQSDSIAVKAAGQVERSLLMVVSKIATFLIWLKVKVK